MTARFVVPNNVLIIKILSEKFLRIKVCQVSKQINIMFRQRWFNTLTSQTYSKHTAMGYRYSTLRSDCCQ